MAFPIADLDLALRAKTPSNVTTTPDAPMAMGVATSPPLGMPVVLVPVLE